MLVALLGAGLLAGIAGRLPLWLRLAIGCGGVVVSLLALGATAQALTPEGNTMARVAPASGVWLLLLGFALMAADALSRMRLTLTARWLMLAGAAVVIGAILWSGWLDDVSVIDPDDVMTDRGHGRCVDRAEVAASDDRKLQ